jgi:hypothetical protein
MLDRVGVDNHGNRGWIRTKELARQYKPVSMPTRSVNGEELVFWPSTYDGCPHRIRRRLVLWPIIAKGCKLGFELRPFFR